jgi:hypothetical protein
MQGIRLTFVDFVSFARNRLVSQIGITELGHREHRALTQRSQSEPSTGVDGILQNLESRFDLCNLGWGPFRPP